jgi:hypothetical protein
MSDCGVEFKTSIPAAGETLDPEVRFRPRMEHILFNWRVRPLRSDPLDPNRHLSHPRELLFQHQRRIFSLRFGSALRRSEVQRR